jgi:hypothetical protein
MIYSKRFCGKSRTKHIVCQINIYDLAMKKKINSHRQHLRNEGRDKEGKKGKCFSGACG